MSLTTSTSGKINNVMAIATTASVRVIVRSTPGPSSGGLFSAIPSNMSYRSSARTSGTPGR